MSISVKVNRPGQKTIRHTGNTKKIPANSFLGRVEKSVDVSIVENIKKTSRPKVLFVCDVMNWAWYFKSVELKKYLSNEFDIDIACVLTGDKIDPNKYDIYFTFGYSYIDIDPLKAIPRNRKVTGITSHRPNNIIAPKMKLAGAVHANSKLLLSQLRTMHDNIYYLPNGVNEQLFQHFLIPPIKDNITIGHVGKLSPLKGQIEFIEPAITKAHCLYHPHYQDHTEAFSQETMPSVYKEFDAFIVASQEDGTPNPALEAAACGRPIISNRVGNMPEFIQDGVNGFLVEKNIDKYVEKILWLRDHRDKLIKMGNAARQTVMSKWTWRIQAENYRKMLWDIIESRRSQEASEKSTIKERLIDVADELQQINSLEKNVIIKREALKLKTEMLKKDIKELEKEGVKLEKPNKIIKKPSVKKKPGQANILILSDVVGWAWDVKARNIQKHLSDEFNINIRYFQSSSDNRFNKAEDFDLYFIFDCGAAHFLTHKPANKKLIGVTSHTYTNIRGDWKGMLDGAKFHHANSVMLQKELQKYYDDVFYLPNGVDEDEFSYLERNIEEPFTACYVGKNTERKGYVQYIVEACKRAEVTLKSQVCRFNSPNVIKHNDMPNHYNGADVILIASDMDGTPNQLLEGASRGRTFIGNSIGNVPEFVNNDVNGFLVERNVNSYVEKLNWLKGHRAECKEMGLAARKTVEEGWTWKIQAENYRMMFREALKG